MRMKKFIYTGLAAILACISLASCTPSDPIKVEVDHNIKSYLLGVVDGCNLWQVDVPAKWIYFVKCPNADTTVNWQEGSKSKTQFYVKTDNR